MTAFVVTYTTRSGQRREMTLTADNPSVARRELRRRGILPHTLVRKETPRVPQGGVKKANSSFSGLADLLEGPVTIRDKALFANKLSALVDAGVPILRSLDLMRMQQKSTKMRLALAGMTQDVNQGDSLGNSMRRWPKVFDNLSIALVEAGEAGGVLDDTLKRLAKLLEDNAKLQNQIKGAMSYPVTVLVIAIAVFLGMTIFLIPTFSSVFDQLGAELPLFTQMMLNLSNFLRSWKALILVGGLVGFAFWVVATYNTPMGRRQIDGLLLKLPLFGELLVKSASAQFCRTLSSLSKAGVPILLSLEIVRETATNSVISDAIISCKNEVSEGMPLSAALRMKNVFPEMCVNMLAIGEETGEMDAMLSKVADFYEDEVSTMVKAMTSMLEPAMIVLVGLIVGSVLLAMYLPMFSIYEHVR
ncbi:MULTISPECIES: type II secretion system F family protein [unclassified Cyanobium]|uniref:type II secretion system F family protein n=1 Tax=unclassified Cyanobium TaxID=2627006 RepID=UPI0020CFE87C|nr:MULTISPECIES: type II secretion system F family protein [unclassified Cyanobium]MCP9857893.1 type II secretion system F family protein [Cyanobium sp. Cruz-8H5]MCP9865050.1 type II secretion system F family protein [Cyanobium sp. Cruz-8D1]